MEYAKLMIYVHERVGLVGELEDWVVAWILLVTCVTRSYHQISVPGSKVRLLDKLLYTTVLDALVKNITKVFIHTIGYTSATFTSWATHLWRSYRGILFQIGWTRVEPFIVSTGIQYIDVCTWLYSHAGCTHRACLVPRVSRHRCFYPGSTAAFCCWWRCCRGWCLCRRLEVPGFATMRLESRMFVLQWLLRRHAEVSRCTVNHSS